MKNNVIIVVLVVLVGLIAGVGLLIGIGNVVNLAVSPLTGQVQQLASHQQELLGRINALEQKLNNAPARPTAPAPMPPTEDYNQVYDLPIGDSVIIGKAEAPNTIVKFSDFQCPFCHRFYGPVKEVLAAYPDDVKLVIKHFPLGFHPLARPAAKVALAAHAQGKYEEMIDLLLESGADVSEAKLKEYSQTLGIKADQLLKDLKDNDAAYEAIIKADEALASQVDVRGTPTFFLNGKKTDARSPEQWKSAIEALKK